MAWQEAAWWVLTVAIFLAWWAYFARRQAREFSLAERILAAFIATIGQILATTFLLGWAHQLYWWPLGIVNAAFTLMLAVRTAIDRSGWGLHREIGCAVIALWRLLRSSMAIWVIGALALFISGWVIYLGQLLPPYCWDAWGQHLGWAAFAHQEGHLGTFQIDLPYVNFYPKNTGILFLWWVIGAGTERWSNVAQAPFAFAAALSCYLMARRAGARRVDAAVAGLLVFSVPTVFHQMWMAMADLALMGAFLSSLAFLSRRRLTPAALALAGCAAGFALATKGSSIIFIVGGPLVFLMYRMLPFGMDALSERRGGRTKRILLALVVFGGLAMAFGSYFYLRNWVRYGNPTVVHDVRIGNVLLFEGPLGPPSHHFGQNHLAHTLYDALHEDSEWPVVLDGFFDPQLQFYQGNRIGGWGAPWTVLMLPAIPIALLWALLRRRWSAAAIIAACLLPYFLFYYNHTWARFLLPVIGAGTTAFAFLLSMLRRTPFRRPLLAVAALCMLGTIHLAGLHGRLKPDTIADARLKPYQLSDRFVSFGNWGEMQFSEALRSVQQPGTTLAFTKALPWQKTLAFWNPTFTNRAVQVQYESDGRTWESALHAAGADAVYVHPGSEALSWASTHQRTFTQLYHGSQGGIYRLVQEDEPD